MKILYCAIDQTVPGTIGGSVHVRPWRGDWRRSVTRSTCSSPRVTVRSRPDPSAGSPMAPPFGATQLRWMRSGACAIWRDSSRRR